MFRSYTTRIAHSISDVIDEMLIGDFDYVTDETGTYADVDHLAREARSRPLPCEGRAHTPALAPLTATAR